MKTSLRHLLALVLVPGLFLVGCEEPETPSSPAIPVAQASTPRTEEQTDVYVTIKGAGTVEMDRPDLYEFPPRCTAPNGDGMECEPMRFDGSGAVTATPSDGWRFVRWELGPAAPSSMVITDPTSRIQLIPKGDVVHLVAVFECIVHPIEATFIEGAMATQYRIDVDSLGAPGTLVDEAGISVQWSGPSCGDWTPQGEQLGTTGRSYSMTWHHPHPPCDATTDHHDAVIRATIRIDDQIIVCEYAGAKSGQGAACK